MRKILMLIAAFALATGAFWVTMLTSPPRLEAKVQTRIDTRELTLKVHLEDGQPSDAF
ncbi:hypothetical protein SAMN02799622_03274 [Methylobacterium sp. UNC378MF]|nr:hypothetical protein SAMN02799622_03274 [Methylobacterium sp. UNC378MF]